MRNASLTDSPAHGNVVQRVQSAPDAISPPFIILTSVLTETQRPTWVFTETAAGSTVTTIVQLGTTQSDSVYTQPAQSKTTRLETVTFSPIHTENVQPVTPTATSSPTTTPTQSIEESPVSSSSDLSALLVHTRSHHPSGEVSLLASSPSNSSPSTWSTAPSSWSKPGVQQITTASSFPSPTSSSSPVTSSPATSSPGAGVFSEATAAEKSSDGSKNSSHKVGTIVGSAVGSAAFVALILLACIFFFRRRRRVIQHQRQHSRQRLLRDSDSIMSFNDMHQSQPPMPPRAPPLPPAPAPPHQRQSDPRIRPSLALAASNQDLSLDRMYLRNENRHTDDSPDLEKSPISPIIHISPPSRSASNYSRASWEDDWQFPDYYDPSSRTSLYENTYYYPGGTSMLPNDSHRASECIVTPRTRDSRRSNPFDLEPPPNTLQKWPALPFNPGAAHF